MLLLFAHGEQGRHYCTYEINAADVRKLGLTPTDDFEIVQHIELLDLPIHVTEHRLRKYLDGDGNTVLPDVPELKDQPIFGPRMLSMIGWLKSRAHCSYSTIAVWMSDVLQVRVSRGYLANLFHIATSRSRSVQERRELDFSAIGVFDEQVHWKGSLECDRFQRDRRISVPLEFPAMRTGPCCRFSREIRASASFFEPPHRSEILRSGDYASHPHPSPRMTLKPLVNTTEFVRVTLRTTLVYQRADWAFPQSAVPQESFVW